MKPYLLLTPGPLTTSEAVKAAMLTDWCTWDDNYNQEIVQVIRSKLVKLATSDITYTSVLMQGSGTASVEASFGTFISNHHKVLIINNGAYGQRMVEISQYLNIEYTVLNFTETQLPDLDLIAQTLKADTSITHIAMVHCETTTGMLNPAEQVGKLAHAFGKIYLLDAMSSFGGMVFDIANWHVDIMISSANKCLQGVPGFGFVICKKDLLEQSKGQARSLTLDLYAQWHTMETQQGKWRFTSPTHVVRAFYQALVELEQEGGVAARFIRYQDNQHALVVGMQALGFTPLLAEALHSPFITSFYSPITTKFQFKQFYGLLKQAGFVIYPGKVSTAECFRIGNIGEVYLNDIEALLGAVQQSCYWLNIIDN